MIKRFSELKKGDRILLASQTEAHPVIFLGCRPGWFWGERVLEISFLPVEDSFPYSSTTVYRQECHTVSVYAMGPIPND